jgi:hypothetical protein
MPGIFGLVGYSAEVCEKFRHLFEAPWGSSQSTSLGEGVLGGHSFEPFCALNTDGQGLVYAVDGEVSTYASVRQRESLFDLKSNQITLRSGCKGNVAVVDERSGLWFLAADWLGIFPLYYLVTKEGLIFCSRQLPIARLLSLSEDSLGVISWLMFNYTFAGRTFFQSLRRLLPGQVLSYDPVTKRKEIRETSRAWVGDVSRSVAADELAELCWDSLSKAVSAGLPKDFHHSIMVSGGWDSRLLLAVLRDVCGAENILGYFHGDVESREARITDELCRSMSISFHGEPLDDRIFFAESLRRGFDRTEDVTFPNWHHAGAVLHELGCETVSAGVSGEIMGGRYSHVMRLGGVEKGFEAVRLLLAAKGWGGKGKFSTTGQMIEFLRIKGLSKPWFINKEYWGAIQTPLEALNADIMQDIKRLIDRGVVDPGKLAEAFISEHWGAVYQGAQILSCRGSINVALPFADQKVLEIASQIAIEAKIQNSLTQRILKLHARNALKLPTAAMLIPANFPILVQEASRGLRKIVSNGQLMMHYLSKGFFNRPSFSWVNYEFLNSGDTLRSIFSDFRSPIWDQKAIEGMIHRVAENREKISLHSVAEILMKMYTVDLSLR